MTADGLALARAAGVLFLLAFIPALAGGVMFSGRRQLHWAAARSSRYLYWERSLWVAGIILLTLGYALFTDMLQAEGEIVLSRLGMTGFLIGAILIVVAEGFALDTEVWTPYLVRLSVIVTLLSEAAFGAAMLRIEVLPQWVGWATLILNVGGLALLLRAKDPYFPGIYYIMPLILGVILVTLPPM